MLCEKTLPCVLVLIQSSSRVIRISMTSHLVREADASRHMLARHRLELRRRSRNCPMHRILKQHYQAAASSRYCDQSRLLSPKTKKNGFNKLSLVLYSSGDMSVLVI